MWSSKLLTLFLLNTATIETARSDCIRIYFFLIVQIGHDWLMSIMSSNLPKYMKEVLGFPVHDVGLYSSLPYLLMGAVSVTSGFYSDFLINNRYLTITQARKIFTAVGTFNRDIEFELFIIDIHNDNDLKFFKSIFFIFQHQFFRPVLFL